jgi:hypothetical protein
MNETASTTVWLACPQCRWRHEFPADTAPVGSRCHQCGSAVVLSPPQVMAKTTLPAVGLTPELVELPPVSGVEQVMTPDPDEIQLSPVSVPLPPSILPSTIPRGSVSVETQRDDVVEPPPNATLYWAFTNNIFQFPFRLYALPQWIFSAIGLTATAECLLLSLMGLYSQSMAGGLQAGIFALVGLLFLAFSLSYITSCFIDIAVNAAYNVDKAHDWPNPDYRERLLFFLGIVWVTTLAGTAASAVALIGSMLAGDIAYLIFFPTLGILFPIFLLAGLEADSLFWPASKAIYQSLKNAWRAWLCFYLISGALGAGCGLLTWALLGASPFLIPLVAGPVWAAAIFIYGRMLGRLAWFILQKADLPEEKQKAKRNTEHDRWDI